MLNLAEFRDRSHRLADWLPWACLVAQGIILNKDGSFQRTVRYRGPDLDSATDDELMTAASRVNNVLKRFSSGWALFFDAERLPSSGYPSSCFPDPVSWLVDEERRANFEDVTDDSSLSEPTSLRARHYESAFHLTFVYLPPPERVSRFEGLWLANDCDTQEPARVVSPIRRWFRRYRRRTTPSGARLIGQSTRITNVDPLAKSVDPRGAPQRPSRSEPVPSIERESAQRIGRSTNPTFSYHKHLESFIQETNRAIDLFSSILPEMAPLNDAQTLTYLHGCISTKRHPVSVPDIPVYLDAFLCDQPFFGGIAPAIGRCHLRTVTVLGFPAVTFPGILDDLNRLGIPYRWVTRFIALDRYQAGAVLRRYRRQWFAKRKSVSAVLKEVMFNESAVLLDSDAGNKAADADAALQELGDDVVSFGYMTTIVTVSDEESHAAEEKLRAVERAVNARGFSTIRESINAVEAWLGSLPGQVYANVRQPIVHTLNLAHMCPLSAVWAGPERCGHLSGPPLLLARTKGATPFRLALHVGDVGHTLIVGPTGAGKSVLLSLLALQFRRYQASRLIFFDKGRSARATTLALKGAWYELGARGGLGFQPLHSIDDDDQRLWALDWLCGVVAHEHVNMSPDIKEAIWSALRSLASAPVSERTMTGLVALLSRDDLRQAMEPYTLEGPYGRFLDADHDLLTDTDVVTFEMEELIELPGLVAPVLTYLFHALERRFDGRPTLLVLDEAWIFLDDPLFAHRIREWLKTLRKKNVAVLFSTQSLADIAASRIAPAIIESCPTRIFLPNPRACEPGLAEIYARFGLNDTQVRLIAEACPKRDYYLQSRAGNRLFELGLGPIALAFAASATPQDQLLIDATFAAAGPDDFARAYLVKRGLQWAADLLPVFEQLRAARSRNSSPAAVFVTDEQTNA